MDAGTDTWTATSCFFLCLIKKMECELEESSKSILSLGNTDDAFRFRYESDVSIEKNSPTSWEYLNPVSTTYYWWDLRQVRFRRQ